MAGNPNWKRGGKSPNASGRPRGIVDKRMRLNKALMADADALLQVTKAKAMEGDMTAMSLLLSRAVPTLKAESGERVEFEFDASKTVADQLLQVAAAVASGQLTIDQGKQFAEILHRIATVRALNQGGDSQAALIDAMKEFAKVCPA